MNAFESEYYESPSFWEGEMLQDGINISRFDATELLIPDDVKKLADVGCGNGAFVNRLILNKPSLEIFATDRSKKALEFVKTSKAQAEITALPFDDRYFDCVTCLEVIEHLGVKDFELALKELSRAANKYIIVSVPFDEKIEESFNQCPACKSIFNQELHLQSFNESKFVGLFDHLGFKNVRVQKMNPIIKYKGHFQYRKLFYPEQFLQWRSPICPLCGFSEERKSKIELVNTVKLKQRRSLISYLGQIPKLFWPKDKSYYWIMGLFQRVSE